MVMLSYLKEDEMIKTRMKTPPLDQTEGRKEGNLVKMLRPPKIQGLRKRSLQAPPKTFPVSIKICPASLPMQRSQVIPLRLRACNKIKSSSRETIMKNPMTKRLPKLIGSRNLSDLQLLILIEVKDNKLTLTTSDWIIQVVITILKNVPKQQLNDLTGITLKTNRIRSIFESLFRYRGRQIIPKDYFINKDLEYLKGGDLSRHYSTLVTKTKAATYELKWIEDLVHEL
ncbi:hypothetical protein Tco_0018114 [Tanacetum coccineum]